MVSVLYTITACLCFGSVTLVMLEFYTIHYLHVHVHLKKVSTEELVVDCWLFVLCIVRRLQYLSIICRCLL